MGRTRTELSKNNQFWISKHRYYELKHFCLQYSEWKELYLLAKQQSMNIKDDPTGIYATIMADCQHCITLVENTAKATDVVLGRYILDHVTKGTSYVRLRTIDNIPCGKDLFYTLCQKFFWLLSNEKGV